MPRLNHSIKTIESILFELRKKESELTKNNLSEITNYHNITSQDLTHLKLEKTVIFSVESLLSVHKLITSFSKIANISSTLPHTITVLRTISAQLSEIMPECSHKILELSASLGSIVIDSGTITEAKFDFKVLNKESNLLLDEAKLMADSKINKLHPNQDF